VFEPLVSPMVEGLVYAFLWLRDSEPLFVAS